MMMRSKPARRFVTAILVTLSVGAGIGLALRAQRLATRRVPGPQPQQEVTLLANGWRLSPAGRHVAVGNLPLAMIESFDGRFLIVSNDGYGKPSLSIIETATWTEKGRMPLADAWLGLAWHPDGRHLFSATGTRNTVQELLYQDGQIAPARTFQLPLRDGQTW